QFFRKLAAIFRSTDADLIEEQEAHRQLIEEELRRSMPAAEAAAESRRRMGNVTLSREDSRDVWSFVAIDRFRQHLHYGLRGLRREPAFALTTLLTLALGTAATTTAFSVANAELWRPLPYEKPEELLSVVSRADASKSTDRISFAEFQSWRERATAFS